MRSTTYRVRISDDATDDLKELVAFIASTGSRSQAKVVSEALRERIRSLSTLPSRGNVPPELWDLDISIYREIHEPPYRVVYRVLESGDDGYAESTVMIYAVFDSRQNLAAIMPRRLARS